MQAQARHGPVQAAGEYKWSVSLSVALQTNCRGCCTLPLKSRALPDSPEAAVALLLIYQWLLEEQEPGKLELVHAAGEVKGSVSLLNSNL